MCTLSHLPDSNGYWLFFNRDEQRDRSAEIPPSSERSDDGTRFLAPRDSASDGTWIMVNEWGLCVALLNESSRKSGVSLPADQRPSRGLLPLVAASARDRETAAERYTETLLRSYAPCRLAIAAPDRTLWVVDWDGHRRRLDRNVARRLPLASSGFDHHGAIRRRRARWAELLAARGGVVTPALLADFHRDHRGAAEPGAKPDAYSVCMHRADAETRSQCRVRVDASEILLDYRPGPPCHCAAPIRTRLELRVPRSAAP